MNNNFNFHNAKKLIIAFIFGIILSSRAQQTLFGVKNSANNFQFIGIDCTNDSIIVINTMPVSYYGSTFSSTIDQVNQKYYYSTGHEIYKIDISTGISEDTIAFTNIHPFYLYNIIYNETDGFIYGVQQHFINLQSKFVKLNLSTGAFVNLGQLPVAIDVGVYCKSSVNLQFNEYIIQSKKLTAINMTDGSIRYSYLIDSTSFDTFNHIKVNCKDNSIYGLFNDEDNLNVYFSSFDTISGIVNVINSTPLPVNFYGQNQSGSTIDLTTDIFYYATLNGNLYGVDIHSGNIVYSHNYGPGFEFLFLESASQFHCPLANVESIDNSSFHIYPNPTNSLLTVQSDIQTIERIRIMDISGKVVISKTHTTGSRSLSIDLSNLSNGMYVVLGYDKSDNLLMKSKIIKN